MAPLHSPAAGQASLEYVATVLLVVAIAAAAAPAAGHLPLAQAVAATIRHGLCVVTGGVCTAGEARAAGLEPCTLRARGSGEDNGGTIAIFRAGNRYEWLVAERSDGSVVVTRTDDTDVGAGLAAEALGLSLGGTFDAGFHEGWVWEFPDAAAARRFLHARDAPEEVASRFPPAYEYKSLAGRGGGSVPLIGAAGGSLGVGRRTGRGLETTFLRARVDDPGPFAALAGGGRWEDIVVEYTRESGGRPREIAFRLRGPGSAKNTLRRVTARLDLREPANARFAQALLRIRPPWPPAVVAGLRAATQRALTAGTVEAELVSVQSSQSGFDVSLPVVKALGVRHLKHRTTARLLTARAWVNGEPRAREDCLPA